MSYVSLKYIFIYSILKKCFASKFQQIFKTETETDSGELIFQILNNQLTNMMVI